MGYGVFDGFPYAIVVGLGLMPFPARAWGEKAGF